MLPAVAVVLPAPETFDPDGKCTPPPEACGLLVVVDDEDGCGGGDGGDGEGGTEAACCSGFVRVDWAGLALGGAGLFKGVAAAGCAPFTCELDVACATAERFSALQAGVRMGVAFGTSILNFGHAVKLCGMWLFREGVCVCE